MTTVTLGGNPIHLGGEFPKTGSAAPAFSLVAADLRDLTLKDFAGKRKVLNIVPSLDTPVCATSTRKFNEQAGSLLAGLKIEPVQSQDQTIGFELGEVPTDSLLERLGVETGDRVLAIDETPARNLDALVRALGAARSAQGLVARLERRGEAFDLRVTVR